MRCLLVTQSGDGYKEAAMISQAERDRFYENLVSTVRANGGVCAITSGMACVA
jgi:hypothetical protein